jgi:hypothetical protein
MRKTPAQNEPIFGIAASVCGLSDYSQFGCFPFAKTSPIWVMGSPSRKGVDAVFG